MSNVKYWDYKDIYRLWSSLTQHADQSEAHYFCPVLIVIHNFFTSFFLTAFTNIYYHCHSMLFNLFKYSSVVTPKGHMRTPFVEENAGLVLHTEAVTKSIYLLDKVFTSNSS